MRGFRPSYFRVRSEEVIEELERIKQENMQRYIDRVQQGLPLFEEEQPALSPLDNQMVR